MTIVHSAKVTVSISNINQPKGGPLLLPQFEALRGFLEAKAQQRLSVNTQDARISSDYRAFFAGFCKRQRQAPGSGGGGVGGGSGGGSGVRLFLGKRHINAAIRAQEFRFLVEVFRGLQVSVRDLSAKFSRATDTAALQRPAHDEFAEYDQYDLIAEEYIRPEQERLRQSLLGAAGAGAGAGGGFVSDHLHDDDDDEL